MLTVKYIIFILFYLITIVYGHNGLRLKTSSENIKKFNLETLLELHKDAHAGRILNKDGTLTVPPQKNTAISKLVFLVDVINEILNEGLSEQENEVLSNIIPIHRNENKNQFNEKKITEDILSQVLNNIIESEEDVNEGKETVQNKINTYLLSDEITQNNLTSPKDPSTYFLSKEMDGIKEESPMGLNPNIKPMENKWHKLLNESLKIMEYDNKKDLKTVKPVIDDIINKNFKLHKSFEHKSKKENSTFNLIDKGYPKSKRVLNNTGKSINIKVSNINYFNDDDDDNIDIDIFDDVIANGSSPIGNPNYRGRLKVSADEINDYRRNVDGLKKLHKPNRHPARRNFVEVDPNYNEDDYYWRPSPLLTRRIYQGIPVRITDFPFMASIHMFQTLQCAGSIIKSDLVLTAASCLQIAWNNRFFRENPRFLTVRVGSTRFFGGGEVIEVSEVYFHPHYKPKTLTSNLAIIRLYRNLRFSNVTTRYVVKIHYDREDHKIPDNNPPVTLIGFGAVRPSNRLHAKGFGKLQYAILPIYPFGDCKDIYSKEYVTKHNFCAGLMAQGSGACNHDVGDPGISEGVILGIVSFGSPICGRVDTPTVFTKIGQFKDWIDEIYKIEPLVYLHRYSTTSNPVPIEPVEPKPTKRFNTTEEAGRNMGMAKLSNNGQSKKPFKVRPMTKTVDVLEYFPADDPLKMGTTKKRKLRMRPQAMKVMQVSGVASPQLNVGLQPTPPVGIPNVLHEMKKLPFGMGEHLAVGQPPLAVQPPFGMQQPPVLDQQQAGVGTLPQSEASKQHQAVGVMAQHVAAIAQQQSPGLSRKPSRENQQPPHLTTTDSPARKPKLSLDARHTRGTTTESNHVFLPADCNESDIEGTGPNAELCSVSAAAAAMPMTVTRAGDMTPPVDMNIQLLEFDKKNARADPRVPGPKLANANSEAIDDENKVSSLIESIFEPGMQADMHQDPDPDNQDGAQKLKEIDKSIMSMLYVTDKEDKNKADVNENVNNDSGPKDYKVPRGEGLALPENVEIIEIDEPNEFRFRAADDSNENRNFNNSTDQAMGDANNPADQAFSAEEPNKFRSRSAADSNENNNCNNPVDQAMDGINSLADQAMGEANNPRNQAMGSDNIPIGTHNSNNQAKAGEGSDHFDFGTYFAGLLSPDQPQDPSAAMADEVTNIPRYRDETEPPEGYYLDQ